MTTLSAGIINTSDTGTPIEWSTTSDWDAEQSSEYVVHDSVGDRLSDQLQIGRSTSVAGTGAYWPFDEDSGSTANDVSGNSNDGTVDTGSVTVGSGGVFGTTSFSFDGVDISSPAVDAGDVPLHDVSSVTYGGWVYLVEKGQDRALMSRESDTSGFSQIWYDASDDLWATTYHDGGYNSIYASTYGSPVLNVWVHIVARIDVSAGNHELFVDGVSEGTATIGSSADSTASFTIGSLSTGSRMWSGRIEEPFVTHELLTDSQIATLAGTSGTFTTDFRTADGPLDTLETTSTLAGGSIDVTVNRDTDGDGVADTSETIAIGDGSSSATLSNAIASGDDVWLEVAPDAVSPPNGTVLNSARIV